MKKRIRNFYSYKQICRALEVCPLKKKNNKIENTQKNNNTENQ